MVLKFVCLMAVFVLTVQGGPPAMKKMLHDQCVQESGASEEMVADANKGKFSDSEALKCYMKCIFTTLSALDDEGNFNADVLLGLLPPEMQESAREIVMPCAQEKGANLCEQAFNINKCFFKQNEKKYFLM